MKIRLNIVSDYVCPFCYVGQDVVNKLKENYDVEVDWSPFYLRPDTPPEGTKLPPDAQKHMQGRSDWFFSRAKAAGMTMVFPDFLPNTRLAHEATEFAREKGRLEEFHSRVFRLYYAEGRDISSWEVLREAATDAGLDGDEMQNAVESGKYRDLVAGKIAEAQELGIEGVPTYILNDRYAIVGAQPYELFEQAVKKLEDEEPQQE
jgi:predicted DsbA family dithiol-disulfide isomerase